jgi:GT2 family glycosyltransferase/peptidoglycan/xylan/chitin deacetylase (PgdA/CDA1 family)
MKCSVVIPTHMRAGLLKGTLDSLAHETEQCFEVIVVCDGQDPETQRVSETYAGRFPLQWILLPKNVGKAQARNIGADAAKNELLIFLDDDTSPFPDWVFQHRCTHRCLGGGIALVGRVIDVYQRPPHNRTEQLLRRSRINFVKSYEATISKSLPANADREYFNKFFGVNCSISRAAFLDSGGFDSHLRYIDEEAELGSRMYDRGVRFRFQPRAIVEHRDSKDLVEYSLNCWSVTGSVHVFRALQKGQRNPQTAALTGVRSRNPLRRMKVTLSWNHPDLFRRAASPFRAITEATGLELPFRLWCSAMVSTAYWQRVRAEGFTLAGLKQMVGRPLPILCFHSISSDQRTPWRYQIAPKRFQALLAQFRTHKYKFVLPADHATQSGEVALTFDDGYEDFYFEVFPQMASFGLKPLVLVVLDRIGQTNVWDEARGVVIRRLLSLDQIREMSNKGVQFGSHSMTHASLLRLSDTELRREVVDSKSALEDLLGREVSDFAYPYGDHDERVRAAVAQAGYKQAFSTRRGLHHWGDPLSVNRIEISPHDTWPEVQFKLATGHSLRDELSAVPGNLARTALRLLPSGWSSALIETRRRARRPDYHGS